MLWQANRSKRRQESMTDRDGNAMRYGRSWPALLATLALHLLLLLLVWQSGSRVAAPEPQARRLQVRLIAEPPSKPATPRLSRRSPPALVEPTSAAIPIQAIVPPPLPEPLAPAAVATAPTRPASAASAPWTDEEQLRRIVQMHAKQVPITEQAALASQAPKKLSSTERLGRQIQSAADGDCLKGEFAGAGMGLLSLPFWAIAEARGKCRR